MWWDWVVSSFDDLKSHPMADVLLPIARIQAWELGLSRHSNHTFTVIPMNSSRLFTPGWSRMGLVSGILILQTRPDRLYPPIPNGHASDQQIRLGSLVVIRLMGMPRFAAFRRTSQRARSWHTSYPSLRTACWDLRGSSRARSRPRKCLVMGITKDE